MNKFRKAVIAAFASGALLASTLLPVLAQTTIEISGNGTHSDNDATATFTQTTTVVQTNVADVYNKVDASADTGNNDANDNTGGDVSIETGDADVDVKVENTLNSNSAEVNCCPEGPIEVLISGNGSDSDNTVKLGLKSEVEVWQENEADVTNKVYADADTGSNDAKDNTGGSVTIETGDASVGVDLSTSANANSARVGGSGGGGSLSARILGNGTHSDNDIELELLSLVLVSQSNEADVYNKVDADADTGNNDANDNTGGDVSIETGDADVDVTVDNMVNFNWADADCGCLLGDLLAKIAGNGSDSDNTIKATLGQELLVFQGNCAEENHEGGLLNGNGREECELENKVDADADTGGNDAKDNTGDPGGDPSIETGDADVVVELENSGNSNVYGLTSEWDLPDFDFNFNFSFDLSDLLNWLIGQN